MKDFFSCLQRSFSVFFLVTSLAIFFGLQNAQAATTLEPPPSDNYGGLSIYSVLADGASADNGPTTIVYITDSEGNVVTTTIEVDAGQTTQPLYLTPGVYQISENPSDGYVGSFFQDEETEETVQCDPTTDGDVGGRLVVPDERGAVPLVCNISQTPYVAPSFVATTSTLQINEVVVNDNGDTKTVADFPYDISLNGVTTTQSGIATTSTIVSVGDSYNIDLSVPDSYAYALSGDCSGAISQAGGTLVCTITIDDQQLIISNVFAEAVDANTIRLTWDTNHRATSRSLFDLVSHEAPGIGVKYGYESTTDEKSELSLAHSMTIPGLTPDTTYYLRPVSHGSPEVVGSQVSAHTLAASGGGQNFGVGSGGGAAGPAPSPAPAPAPAPVAPQVVLGEKIVAPADPVAPQAVLGFKTLPATGGPAQKYWYVVAAILASLGALVLFQERGDEE